MSSLMTFISGIVAPGGILTQFTASKGDNGASGVKLNAFTSYEGVTMEMRVRRSYETEVQCI